MILDTTYSDAETSAGSLRDNSDPTVRERGSLCPWWPWCDGVSLMRNNVPISDTKDVNTAPAVVTKSKERVEICQNILVLHVFETLGVRLCYTESVWRDGTAKIFFFCCDSVAFFSFDDTHAA